jgi:hypothetical protein
VRREPCVISGTCKAELAFDLGTKGESEVHRMHRIR